MSVRSSENIYQRKNSNSALLTTFVFGLILYALAAAGLRTVMQYPVELRPEKDKIRVACIGDSITYGDGLKDRLSDAYPSQLQDMLGERYQVLNYGMPGKTLQREGSDPFTETSYYRLSQEALPAIVIVMLGTNDAMPRNWNREQYREQLGKLADVYLSLESSPLVFLAIPPAAYCEEERTTAKYQIPPERIRDDVAQVIREVAEERNVTVIDINTLTDGHPEWTLDGIHPNEEGSRVIAKTVAEMIQQELTE